jgi:hypothetical protein
MKVFIFTAPRGTQLEGKRGVTRSSATACLIMWQSRPWFRSAARLQRIGLSIRQLLGDPGMTHNASRVHGCGVLKNRDLRRKASGLREELVLVFQTFLTTKWLLELAYLADTYQHLNILNFSIHGPKEKSVFHRKTFYNIYEQIFATIFEK